MSIPGRKKGYYRAVKSGKEWALKIHKLGEGSVQWALAFVFRNSQKYMKDLIYKDNPFLKMIQKDKDFSGKYMPVPLKYKEDK